MIVVEGALRRLEEPSPEQLVGAVIRVHERVIAGLRALATGIARGTDAPGGSGSRRRHLLAHAHPRHAGSTDQRGP